jgi:Domain of unknown function (DUF4440)
MTDSDVLDLVSRWAAAEQDNDPGGLDAVLAPGFVGVGPAGFVLSREQWLGRYAGGLRNRSFAVEQPEVHRHGPDTAVVVGVDVQQCLVGDRDVSGRYRLTLTAVRSDGAWRVASAHLGALQTSSPPTSPSRPAEEQP